jgi:tetratricopeptide (TPR) repeat protein
MAATSCVPRHDRAAESGDPLAAGWRFACAITNDADDRAECQDRVALTYLSRGDADRALELGERIENWRKGVVLAEAAAHLAQTGRTKAALEHTAQAEAIGRDIQDWQRDRVLVRVAKTKAFLGNAENVGRLSAFYRSNQDYRGEVAAYHALALARDGQVTNALAALDELADGKGFDVSSWRANGYLLLATSGRLDGPQTSNALALAWAASETVPGTRRREIQMELTAEAVALGARAQARGWLENIASNVLNSTGPAHLKAPLAAKLAVGWAQIGQVERLADCERAAEPLIRQLQKIEQPALFALLGEARARLGDVQKGLTYYEHSLELAGQLTNPRPRAIACVEICLSLDRARLRHRQISEGLNRLLAGFGADHG